MAHTFDIRFARSGGVMAWFEAPTNSFRWAGNGRLSIDGQGISVAVKRGMLSLLARNRTRRIPTASLKDVFREGDALRVEFATEDAPRASLRFWANDRDTAAQIVQLLPTSRTVEIEENSPATRFRINWRTVALLGAAIASLALGGIALRAPASGTIAAGETQAVMPQGSRRALPAKLPGVGAPEDVAQAASEPLVFELPVPRIEIVPLVPGMASYEAARGEMRLFIEESDSGRWWGMTVRLHGGVNFHDPGLWPLQEAEFAAARAWLDYSLFYGGSGLGAGSAQREYARRLTNRVYQYVD